ncbi:MAG: hypothetical protein QOH81_2837 [Sphingomonadales bacterium]|jgi:hypothetical protein|nr:hypothetical protein [Sphingomonadales bacterium]
MPISLKREPRFASRSPRIAARLPTVVLLPDDREIRVHIRNISPGGFMAVSSVQIPEGTCFGIEIPGRGIVRAEVCWTDGEAFGASFQTLLKIRKVD